MARGKLITVEGTEGAGKSTVLKSIQAYFEKANQPLLLTREPGGTVIAEKIRQLVLTKTDEPLTPSAELLLMFAGRSQHIHHCILPALENGTWVVSDRYIDASYAYQGGGRGMSLQDIATLDKMIVGDVYPDLTLLLDIAPQLGFERTQQRGGEKDRIEQERMDFFERVRNSYLQRAEQDPKRIKIIDASQPLASVQHQIEQALNAFVAGVSP